MKDQKLTLGAEIVERARAVNQRMRGTEFYSRLIAATCDVDDYAGWLTQLYKYIKFTDVSEASRVNPFGWFWSSTMFDYDNDGRQDIYAVNGWITGKKKDDL